ncbi:MAG: hypothetical protein UT84_C0005G0010 [Candidatus Curtissbacteria bacterium GW2011_GWA1_40_16]|uniref:Fido domain-containing protein n=1 Tax=Candidatus Curtissbacteria bacterium GW2011_GWA1_40_16 TaxID=1618405 RepID=A0A0G0RDS5_9BACT|nr:MAG: hypothetical protein UT84_C0005G0010 [Candidatus Curtissbacteria bacterium GW2011_GWA1_40_16]
MAKSTKPKGATSYKETVFGIFPRPKIIQLEKQGVAKGLKYILKLNSKKAEITPQLICGIHKESFGFIFPEWTGKFRTINVAVGDFEPPHFSKVPELVKDLCADLDERLQHIPPVTKDEKYLKEVVSLLSWFQHQFVWIHPFNDYNGRIARLTTNLIALNLGLPAFEIKAVSTRDRQKYIKAMKAADKHNLKKLDLLIADALKETLQKI